MQHQFYKLPSAQIWIIKEEKGDKEMEKKKQEKVVNKTEEGLAFSTKVRP